MADITTETTIIGPEHRGQRMPLEDFVRAEGRPGHLYELNRGVIIVVDGPDLNHGRIVYRLRQVIATYCMEHPEIVDYVAGGSDAALRLPATQSERHPDVAIYLKPPSEPSQQPWDSWTPEIVVEGIFEGSVERDYVVKREEYLRAGVRIYWIIDRLSRAAVILKRRGDAWDERNIASGDGVTLPLLPGFELPSDSLFAGLS